MNITGFVQESIVAARREPSHLSEMVTQLLFGELVHILETRGYWYLVKSLEDQYTGWVMSPMVQRVSEAFMSPDQPYRLVNAPVAPLEVTRESETTLIYLPKGAMVPEFRSQNQNKLSFTIDDATYSIDAQYLTKPLAAEREELVKTAKTFLNVPYLWGGKTHFGADCSGFTQMVFRMHGMKLPRDSFQQATVGKVKTFAERETGDLAFFKNANGKVIHVALLISKERVIHAAGRVRIDFLTQKGIYNLESQKLTHTLHSIQSFI